VLKPLLPTARPARPLRRIALAGVLVAATLASPALAGSAPSTKLVRCGEESCLRVSGKRADPAMTVSVNGRAVTAEGQRAWHVDLPVAVVREWSAPFAREIEVTLHDASGQASRSEVALPIGLLGGATQLASLVVGLR
jgi:hypothetical protein